MVMLIGFDVENNINVRIECGYLFPVKVILCVESQSIYAMSK